MLILFLCLGEGWEAGRGSCLVTLNASGPATERCQRSLLFCLMTKILWSTPMCPIPPISFLTLLRFPLTHPTSTHLFPLILVLQVGWPMGRGTKCWLAGSHLRGQSSTCWSGRGQPLISTLTHSWFIGVTSVFNLISVPWRWTFSSIGSEKSLLNTDFTW